MAPTTSVATSTAPSRAKNVRLRMITRIPFLRTSLEKDPAAGAGERCLRLQLLRLATTAGVSTRGIVLREWEGKQTATRFASRKRSTEAGYSAPREGPRVCGWALSRVRSNSVDTSGGVPYAGQHGRFVQRAAATGLCAHAYGQPTACARRSQPERLPDRAGSLAADRYVAEGGEDAGATEVLQRHPLGRRAQDRQTAVYDVGPE